MAKDKQTKKDAKEKKSQAAKTAKAARHEDPSSRHDAPSPPHEAPEDAEHEVELTAAEAATAAEALERVRARAMALASGDVAPYRVVPALAMVSVQTTAAFLATQRAKIATHLPQVDLAKLDGLGDMALAATAAAIAAERSTPSEKTIKDKLVLARKLRGKLLPVLHSLAANGLIPTSVYADIQAGKGNRDTASDCVDIPAAFATYAKRIVGKHAASQTDIDACAAVGAWLLRNLRTADAPREKVTVSADVDLRNRVGTLLQSDYGLARIVGYYFLQDAFDEAVPPLNSRRVTKTAEPPPVGVPDPVTTDRKNAPGK